MGQRTTVGCIDLAVERRPDLPGGGTVLGFAFGNRCDRPATIDLARVAVVARTFEGQELDLHAYDPNAEIRELRIDGRASGEEAIAYLARGGTPRYPPDPATTRFAEVCVDAASVAHETPSRWLCFASNLPPQVVTR